MFETMPQPTSTVVKSGKSPYGHVEREVKTSFVLNPEADGQSSSAEQVVVTVTTRHSGESKSFYTSVTWVTQHQDGAFAVTKWGSDHMSKRIHSAGVARYSVKAMEAFHATSMAQVKVYWDMGVSEVFHEAAERNGLFATQEA